MVWLNGGSQLAMGTVSDIADVSRIFANTNAAAAGGSSGSSSHPNFLQESGSDNGAERRTRRFGVNYSRAFTPTLGVATLIGGVGG